MTQTQKSRWEMIVAMARRDMPVRMKRFDALDAIIAASDELNALREKLALAAVAPMR